MPRAGAQRGGGGPNTGRPRRIVPARALLPRQPRRAPPRPQSAPLACSDSNPDAAPTGPGCPVLQPARRRSPCRRKRSLASAGAVSGKRGWTTEQLCLAPDPALEVLLYLSGWGTTVALDGQGGP
ncbi:uncharacterized protein LOC119473287 isoform X2 [Cebus imitator]|uniref:uncharacterized protein LOC119473287 isoform X2 n=1 Tax=Cebus imitator TaxID=2715852 RepID=UPI001898D828|nr:uncharacterized protein LOC119473287 isoform X2 [Cebus imitator]